MIVLPFSQRVPVPGWPWRSMLRHKAWLLAHRGPENYGKIILLGCFLQLTLAHLAEGRGMGPFFGLDAAHTTPYGRHLFHRRDHHDSGLRRYPAEVSLATSRDIDCDKGGADVRLFNGVFVRDPAGRLDASLALGFPRKKPSNDEYRQPLDL